MSGEEAGPGIVEVAGRIYRKLSDHPMVVLGIGVAIFLINPKPILKILRPAISHIGSSYKEMEYLDTQMIVFTSRPIDRQVWQGQLGILPIQKVRVLDYKRNETESQDMAQIWGRMIHDKIKESQCQVVVVLAQPNIVRHAQMSLYSMEQSERYKLNLITATKIHVLKRYRRSYELKQLEVEL